MQTHYSNIGLVARKPVFGTLTGQTQTIRLKQVYILYFPLENIKAPDQTARMRRLVGGFVFHKPERQFNFSVEFNINV